MRRYAGPRLAQVATSLCRPSFDEIDPYVPEQRCLRANRYAVEAITRLRPDIVILAQKVSHAETDWKQLTEKLLALEVRRDDYTVYVRPELVVEVAFGGIQESPRYPAGLALRFARVKRYRPEKNAGEADTIGTVMGVFERQGGGAAT